MEFLGRNIIGKPFFYFLYPCIQMYIIILYALLLTWILVVKLFYTATNLYAIKIVGDIPGLYLHLK